MAALSALTLGVTAASDSSSEDPGAISGTVRADDGVPLAGVTARIASEGSTYESVTATDKDGRYAFARIEAGTYRLTASLPGFRSMEIVVTVFPAERLVVDLRMQIAPLTEKVTGRAAPVPRPPSQPSADRKRRGRWIGCLPGAKAITTIVRCRPARCGQTRQNRALSAAHGLRCDSVVG